MPVINIEDHWLHKTPKTFLGAFNEINRTQCTNIQLHFYLFYQGWEYTMELESNGSLEIPTWGIVSPNQHIAFNVLDVFRNSIVDGRVAGFQLVDFAFDKAIIGLENKEAITLHIAIVACVERFLLHKAGTKKWTLSRSRSRQDISAEDGMDLMVHDRVQTYKNIRPLLAALTTDEYRALVLRNLGVSVLEMDIRANQQHECVLMLSPMMPLKGDPFHQRSAIDLLPAQKMLFQGVLDASHGTDIRHVHGHQLFEGRAKEDLHYDRVLGWFDRRNGAHSVVLFHSLWPMDNFFRCDDGRVCIEWQWYADTLMSSGEPLPTRHDGRVGSCWI